MASTPQRAASGGVRCTHAKKKRWKALRCARTCLACLTRPSASCWRPSQPFLGARPRCNEHRKASARVHGNLR
eukprot:5265093-Alexandrium_andersonii.AAC.1